MPLSIQIGAMTRLKGWLQVAQMQACAATASLHAYLSDDEAEKKNRITGAEKLAFVLRHWYVIYPLAGPLLG